MKKTAFILVLFFAGLAIIAFLILVYRCDNSKTIDRIETVSYSAIFDELDVRNGNGKTEKIDHEAYVNLLNLIFDKKSEWEIVREQFGGYTYSFQIESEGKEINFMFLSETVVVAYNGRHYKSLNKEAYDYLVKNFAK